MCDSRGAALGPAHELLGEAYTPPGSAAPGSAALGSAAAAAVPLPNRGAPHLPAPPSASASTLTSPAVSPRQPLRQPPPHQPPSHQPPPQPASLPLAGSAGADVARMRAGGRPSRRLDPVSQVRIRIPGSRPQPFPKPLPPLHHQALYRIPTPCPPHAHATSRTSTPALAPTKLAPAALPLTIPPSGDKRERRITRGHAQGIRGIRRGHAQGRWAHCAI